MDRGGTASFEAETGRALESHKRRVAEAVARGSGRHDKAFENFTDATKAALAEARAKLDSARAEAVIRSRLAARAVAGAAQKEAEEEIRSLEEAASKMQAEGNERLASAEASLASLKKAVEQVRHWREKWPQEDIARAIELAKEAQQNAPKMHSLAVEAETLDAELDDKALSILGVIEQAMSHSQKGALVSRTAIDQAEQNAAKLKAIVRLMEGATEATTAAKEHEVDTAVA